MFKEYMIFFLSNQMGNVDVNKYILRYLVLKNSLIPALVERIIIRTIIFIIIIFLLFHVPVSLFLRFTGESVNAS